MPADLADKMKPSTELPVNATLDITETIMDIVSNPTSDPTATATKDMMKHSRPVSVLMEPSSSEVNANLSLNALPTLTTTASPVSANQDIKIKPAHAYQLTPLSLHAPPTHTSTVFPVPVTPDSSNKPSTHVPHALLEHHGTEESAMLNLPLSAIRDTSSTHI